MLSFVPSPIQPFDIIDHVKKTKIQMSVFEYLQSNPDQLDRLVQCVKNQTIPARQEVKKIIPDSPKNMPILNNLVITPPATPGKIEPFYVFLLINGY